MRTFGIEEEFIFLKPVTLQPANVGDEVHAELRGRSPVSRFVSHEFLASQIERSTPVFDRIEQASADLLAFRSRLARAALNRGVLAAGVGAPFQTEGWPEVTDVERYHTVETEFGGLVPDHLINGLHVHVGIPSREAGVQARSSPRQQRLARGAPPRPLCGSPTCRTFRHTRHHPARGPTAGPSSGWPRISGPEHPLKSAKDC